MPAEVHDRDEDRESSAKRRKIALACEGCRSRKVRCNGAKPQCGNCVQRLERCIYRVSKAQLDEANEYIEALVGKISELEGEVQQLREAPLVNSASRSQSLESPRPSTTARSTQSSHHRRGIYPEDTRQGYDSRELSLSGPVVVQQSLVNTSGSVDAMGGTATIGDLSQAGEKFYGPSSATSFMKQLYSMVSPSNTLGSASGLDTTGNTTPSWTNSTGGPQLLYGGYGDFSLMPRPLTDHLVNLYWRKVYHVYPFIHEATFVSAYEQLWKPASERTNARCPGLGLGGSAKSGPGSSIFHCALNAIMVLGLQFSAFPLAEKVTLTDTLFHRSKSYFSLEMFDDGSIEAVQTLLLLTPIFQFTTVPTRCWSAIGSACRLAQGLGLHNADRKASGGLGSDEIELRKRIWCSCLMLDTVVSMTLGRPAAIAHSATFPVPSVPLQTFSQNSQGRDAGGSSDVAFFIEAVKLYRTLSRVLVLIYGQHDGNKLDSGNGYGSFDRLVELQEELTCFASQIPEPLKWSSDSTRIYSSPMLAQQSRILHARYLHVQIVLYRPTFTHFCRLHSSFQWASSERENPSQDLLELPPVTSFAQIASMTCVKRAIDLIVLTHQSADTEATGAWWYNMYYTRTAAMVILMATVCPMICESIGRSILHSLWEYCRSILSEKLPQHVTVRNCLQTLEQLFDHIRSAVNHESQRNAVSSFAGTDHGDCPGAELTAEMEQVDDYWGSLFDQSAFNFTLDDFGDSLL